MELKTLKFQIFIDSQLEGMVVYYFNLHFLIIMIKEGYHQKNF